jgi:hypothetical protein
MTFDLITGTATIASGGATSAIAYTFNPSAGPSQSKVVRLYGTMGSFTPLASGSVAIIADTGEILYQTSTVAPTGGFNFVTDVDVFPNYTVRFVVTGDVGSGFASVPAIVKIQVEK